MEVTKDMRKCEHCGRSFINLPLHERRCKTWTPAQREKAWKMWQYRRAGKNKKLGLPANHGPRQPEVAMNGKRVQLTISCEVEDLLRALLEHLHVEGKIG